MDLPFLLFFFVAFLTTTLPLSPIRSEYRERVLDDETPLSEPSSGLGLVIFKDASSLLPSLLPKAIARA